ncbi:MAG: co-chaperone GroES [Planctomycetota bacterium]|jgi:chaperonin GroES
MKLVPMEDRIVVKPQEAEEKTAGGIVLPDSAKERPLMGTVVSVGPGKMLDSGNRGAMSVKKKDVVLYSKYGGTDVEVDGTEYKIFRESEILGIVEK